MSAPRPPRYPPTAVVASMEQWTEGSAAAGDKAAGVLHRSAWLSTLAAPGQDLRPEERRAGRLTIGVAPQIREPAACPEEDQAGSWQCKHDVDNQL